ncbi:MAG: phosphate ABC transporter ATP-binding protein [Candidatus Promineifilaceae bacterium]|nr:phosphate ABC transporter ATP-binding protein [Candidatus Promineifilaceae bacterium]
MTRPILAMKDVSFTYRDGTQALRRVSLEVQPRELTVFFGPSRSGKTTLLRLLNRLSDREEGAERQGTILFHDRNIFDRDVNVSKLRRHISMVFATPLPLPGTIYENMSYGLRMAGMRDRARIDARIQMGLEQAALWDEVSDRLDASAFALSGGQKQRLCLARCLALEPEVILLDNPTSGLDPISTATVERSLSELKAKYTIIMVPHSVQQAARIADKAAFFLDGELIEVGEGGKLFVNPEDERTEAYVTGRFG